MIPNILHNIDDWEILISDAGAKKKKNPNKFNYQSITRECMLIGCSKKIKINRTSGLCDKHEFHQHDLLLSLKDPTGEAILPVPSHMDIIDCMIEWAKSRNFNLNTFFENVSFSILGNIPDVTSLSSEVNHGSIIVPILKDVFNTSINVAEKFFPVANNSSHQPLLIRSRNIPIIVLAHIYIGLIVCEEANRGDRWHCRVVRKDESKTSQLGGAMSIAYYASKSFNWGIELGKSSKLLTR